jgi:tRNA pseudouridine55 synthase
MGELARGAQKQHDRPRLIRGDLLQYGRWVDWCFGDLDHGMFRYSHRSQRRQLFSRVAEDHRVGGCARAPISHTLRETAFHLSSTFRKSHRLTPRPPAPPPMFGILNLNKPSNWTSRDVVNRVQRLAGGAKVGHAGTLDPLATGVLVVCVGPATRLIEYIQRMPKRYRATFLMGRTSDTEDIEGQVRMIEDAVRPSAAQLESGLRPFVGDIEQVPPAYSALKVQGRRAYALARSGQDVALKARRIVIHHLQLLDYDYPEFTLEIVCGSGTYVRSLGRDLARALGTDAIMSALVRTAIGSLRLEDAEQLDALTQGNLSSKLLSPLIGLADLPRITISDQQQRRLAQGLTIDNSWAVEDRELVAIDAAGRLCAIVEPRHGQQLGPIRNFPVS